MAARTVHERIQWFLDHRPSAPGLCLHHTWEAIRLSGAGIPDSNAAVDYLRAHHKLYQGNPPRGAMVLWTSPTHGHTALSLGRNRITGHHRIASTDINYPTSVSRVNLNYIVQNWGHHYAGWTDWWDGETYDVGRPK